MKIVINGVTYTQIKNLNFSPETDITSSEAVINGFSADIITSTDIGVGVNAYLYDDQNNLWAKYWLVEAVRKEKNTLSIIAQSILKILDRKKLDAVMYNSAQASVIIASIFSGLTNEYTLDSSFSNARISGYMPKQTARQRLQWICFCMGAYLKTFFADKIQILPVSGNAVNVPMEKTFWKPSVTYGDYVTAIKATAYSYALGTPENTDKWVKIGDNYYIETSQEFTISNPSAPVTANENVVSVSDVTIINESNVSAVLSLLATYYFKRMEIDAEIINNGQYAAGDKITIPINDSDFVTGYIKNESFVFGLQAKSKVKLIQADTVGGGKLHLVQRFRYNRIGEAVYSFPVGYVYTIQNPYLDICDVANGLSPFSMPYIRTVYLPINENATGTIASGDNYNYQDYNQAIIYYFNTPETYDSRFDNPNMVVLATAIAYILSVDEATSVVEDGKVIVEVG